MNENEKQAIEEMAKVIEITEQIARDAVGALPSPTMYAKNLYWHGYRKQIEGEWKEADTIDDGWTQYRCSDCDWHTESYYKEKHDLHRFCPNCGAKMKGGAE